METGESVASQMGTLLQEVHQRLPTTRIVVMAILPKVTVLPTQPYTLPAVGWEDGRTSSYHTRLGVGRSVLLLPRASRRQGDCRDMTWNGPCCLLSRRLCPDAHACHCAHKLMGRSGWWGGRHAAVEGGPGRWVLNRHSRCRGTRRACVRRRTACVFQAEEPSGCSNFLPMSSCHPAG